MVAAAISGSSSEAESLFDAHSSPATGVDAGVRLMDQQQFAAAMRASLPGKAVSDHSLRLLFEVADRERRGRLTMVDYLMLHDLLEKPNAEFDIAFRLFDVNRNGKVSLAEFQQVLAEYAPGRVVEPQQSACTRLYFGTDGKKPLSYHEFSQFLRGIQEENLYQTFRQYDPAETGFVSVENFLRIITAVFPHKLSSFISQHLPSLGNLYVTGGQKVSWAMVNALNNVLRQMDLVQHIAAATAADTADHHVTKSAFLNMCHRMTRFSAFTPMEVDIIFHMVGLHKSLDATKGQRGLVIQDFDAVLGPWGSHAAIESPSVAQKADVHHATEPLWARIIHPAYNFALGSLAGAIGATVVYPIDLVKTRIQNQRTAVVGELLYKNSWDCFKKVLRNEGAKGLYSGLGPQLVGVAPEKAIKLTMNDLMRGLLSAEDTGQIPLWAEVVSGCVAGGSQVVFTNPLEIVKIRLQVQGESALAQRRGAIDIVKELGILGLYRGASACLLRDIPFSGIYFTAYAHLKKDYFGESETKKLNMGELLLAGAIAGMPAAYLTTPADVIKTRLQVEARKGESTYTGIGDAFRKILREEGPKAFFKGGPARIFRSSPQFGVTLMSYELFKQWLPFPWDPHSAAVKTTATSGVSLSTFASPLTRPAAGSDAGYLRMRNALQLLHDIDYRFGSASG